MDTLDRFIRIIYREQPIHNFLVLQADKDLQSISLHKMVNESFNIGNHNFCEKIRNLYLSIYPDNYNPDEVDEMMIWMKQKTSEATNNTIDILAFIVREMLFYQNGEITVSFEHFFEWNGFINKIDQDIFYALFLAWHSINNHNHKNLITHDNYRLKTILSAGMSENHMHLKGSGYTTDMNWYYFYTSPHFLNWETEDYMPSSSVFNNPENTLAFSKLKIVRLYLVQLAYADLCINKNMIITDADWKDILYSDKGYPAVVLDLKEKIDYLVHISEEVMYPYENSANKFIVLERVLLQKLFQLYLSKELTPLQTYLLNVYILGMSQFKFFFYQDNVNMGFEKFKWAENIKEHFLSKDSNRDIYKTVFDKYYSENKVTQIEFRVSPRSYSSLIQLVDDLDYVNEEIYQTYFQKDTDRKKINYGLIIHYIKDKDEFETSDGLSRKEEFLSKLDYSSKALSALLSSSVSETDRLNNNDNLSYYINKIIGLDTANYEFDCRPELFGPTFRRHREESERSHPLRFTYHVGEDFNTLANGLRAIDEVVEFLQFRRGDRLGHAIALGLDVDEYFQTKRKKIVSKLEEHIDDVVWMFSILYNSTAYNTKTLVYLEGEFERLKYLYFPQNTKASIHDYIDAYRLRGDCPYLYPQLAKEPMEEKQYESLIIQHGSRLNSISRFHKTSFMNPVARELYYCYHFSKKTKEAARKVMVFDATDSYIDAIEECQKIMTEKIYTKEISIETNPSSNRKISHVNRYIDLPVITFAPLSYATAGNPLLISVNTDDSAIFQTDLQSEYAYIASAQIREGENIEKVYDYVERLRKNSYITSFIR